MQGMLLVRHSRSNFKSFWLFTGLQLTGVRPCHRPENSSTLGEFIHIGGWVIKKGVVLSKPYTWFKLQSLLRKCSFKVTKNKED